jgi:uncharacterized protein YjbJ (UPF0337 family)
MKRSTENQVEGTLHELKGAVKKKAGELTDNPKLKVEGQIEQLGGTLQRKAGQLESALKK